MNKNGLRTWGIVIALLLFSGIASVAWPFISQQLSGGTGVDIPAHSENIHLSFPITLPVLNSNEVELAPALAMGILAGITLGGLVVVGGGIAFVTTFLDRMVTNTKGMDTYKKGVAALDQKTNAQIKAMRSQSPTKPIPSHQMPRWSVASTSLIFVIFMIFVAVAISDTLYPHREMILFGSQIDPYNLFIPVSVVLTALALVGVFRRQIFVRAEKSESAGIPWDTIYLIFTGVILVGIGIGLMLWLRTAPLMG